MASLRHPNIVQVGGCWFRIHPHWLGCRPVPTAACTVPAHACRLAGSGAL